jgi:hypothetical protein
MAASRAGVTQLAECLLPKHRVLRLPALNIVFTNNSSTVKGYGPILRFAYIDGLTVTGNVQPLSGGSLTSITDSTSVTYH